MAPEAKTIKPDLRIIVGALLLALSFPRAGLWWCAPIGAAALFWAWQDASWKRSFALGWFAGWIFLSISFWWWSTTIVGAIGPLAYVAVIVAAAGEALVIGVAGALAALARVRARPELAPFAVAAAFTIMEWLRSIGPLGNPFAQLGFSQADSPLRIFAAYIGTSGVTFVVCVLGAYAADALARRTWRPFVTTCVCIALAGLVAWFAWPARTLAAPTVAVSAVQGNIAQSLKWQPAALTLAISRYTAMTAQAAASHPALVVWPETVIAINGGGLNQYLTYTTQFTQLARSANTEIIAGSIDEHDNRLYNGLFLFTPNGLVATYDKRQLVPFAEHFPGQAFLWWLPYVGQLNGNFAEGTGPIVLSTRSGLTIGPLICWESAFGDLAYDDVQAGAQLFVISTDDAWFGTSSGPYQHAQIAQMRAIEFGSYVVRAAATGISGIIAPDGSWQRRAPLETQTVVNGRVGPAVGSVFAHIGPTRVFFAMIALYGLVVLIPRRRRA
jgi:apolipoprotein N-acyltransferase